MFLCMVIGLVALLCGATMLVRGASALALSFGVSPLAVGLTIVAFATSSPELAVSIKSALNNQAELAIGNVVGSNIFNVLIILGLSALITPLRVAEPLIRRDVPLLIGLSVVFWLMTLNGLIGWVDGAILAMGLIVYTIYLFSASSDVSTVHDSHPLETTPSDLASNRLSVLLWQVILIVIGLVLLVAGSNWMVTSAVQMAQSMQVSELVIGLTIVAAGTSLPELVTSIVAAVRGERDIAIGNVVGSNIFNIMGVLGVSSLIAPAGLPVTSSAIWFDIPIMAATGLLLLPMLLTGRQVSRLEGGVMCALYVGYTSYLILG